MDVTAPIDLTGTFAGDLHGMLREAAEQGPLATDEVTGATVVLRQRDVEGLAHDPRLEGIGLTLFDMMGIKNGPLREWFAQLMFTTVAPGAWPQPRPAHRQFRNRGLAERRRNILVPTGRTTNTSSPFGQIA